MNLLLAVGCAAAGARKGHMTNRHRAGVPRLHRTYRRRPSIPAYMTGALRQRDRFERQPGFPDVRLAWRGVRLDGRALGRFAQSTGLTTRDEASILLPHVATFRLQMALLAHPAMPLPIWRALQVRNRLEQHRPIRMDEVLDVETGVAGHRVLEKGLEVGFACAVRAGDELVWESLNSYYYRGRFGAAETPSERAQAPAAPDGVVATWRAQRGSVWGVGRLTGDFNPVHLAGAYARWQRFERAFHHPQRLLGACLARLPQADQAGVNRLEAWLKGPVYYDSEVVLRADPVPKGRVFALFSEGDSRPKIIGRISAT